MTAVYCSGFLLLLCLLTAAECDLVVFATVGYNVTLPCKYDVQASGLSPTCWVQGAILSSGCSNQLIASDGATVRKDSQVSSRYQLLGDLRQGDVSVTILNVSEMDSGQYGCRVKIAGWLNDLKHHFILSVQKATKPTPKRKLDDVTSTEQTILKYTQDYTVAEAGKETGCDDAMDHTEGPVVSVKACQQSDLQQSSIWGFTGNTLRLSFIIFIPALLLTVGYRMMFVPQQRP
ncbi:T-cell immunoglobulin and mucin domain-containing protein 4 isoform X1 [Gadus morhua]|uniref:T-cell immunoglobulin and mucin domain-containing protein 4 isoform X1 n=1 Tax=Gadus morhua TaxID=8049 RepID=UPI0011B51409|nr:T-cell immunoglobulin and mucin domain-containing protein 4-like isoform X1 [Gadus morhua]